MSISPHPNRTFEEIYGLYQKRRRLSKKALNTPLKEHLPATFYYESQTEVGGNTFIFWLILNQPDELKEFLKANVERVDLEHQNDAGLTPLELTLSEFQIQNAIALLDAGAKETLSLRKILLALESACSYYDDELKLLAEGNIKLTGQVIEQGHQIRNLTSLMNHIAMNQNHIAMNQIQNQIQNQNQNDSDDEASYSYYYEYETEDSSEASELGRCDEQPSKGDSSSGESYEYEYEYEYDEESEYSYEYEYDEESEYDSYDEESESDSYDEESESDSYDEESESDSYDEESESDSYSDSYDEESESDSYSDSYDEESESDSYSDSYDEESESDSYSDSHEESESDSYSDSYDEESETSSSYSETSSSYSETSSSYSESSYSDEIEVPSRLGELPAPPIPLVMTRLPPPTKLPEIPKFPELSPLPELPPRCYQTPEAVTIDARDVELIMVQTDCTKEQAEDAMRKTSGDLVEAILYLINLNESNQQERIFTALAHDFIEFERQIDEDDFRKKLNKWIETSDSPAQVSSKLLTDVDAPGDLDEEYKYNIQKCIEKAWYASF